MGDRWGPEGPPPEAYSRLTDPERFAPVVAEADRLVRELSHAYDARVEHGGALPWEAVDGPGPEVVRAVRLVPAVGAPLVVAVTTLPGVVLWAGAWTGPELFPSCGCDACDESAAEVVEHLHEWLGGVVRGGLVERLDRWPRRRTSRLSYAGGASGSERPVDRREYAALSDLSPPGEHDWPAWPRRRAAAVGPTT